MEGGRDMSGRPETLLLTCGGVVEARGEGRRCVAGVEKAARQDVGDQSGIDRHALQAGGEEWCRANLAERCSPVQ